jgi:formamidopyrimidine-DNA glycosylase
MTAAYTFAAMLSQLPIFLSTSFFFNRGGRRLVEPLGQFLSAHYLGKELDGATRRGRFLIVSIKDSDRKLVIHFGTTGSLEYSVNNKISEGAKHLTLQLRDGSRQVWTDMRKFGRLRSRRRATPEPSIPL